MIIVPIIQINLDLQVELVADLQKGEISRERCREREIYSGRCFEATILDDCDFEDLSKVKSALRRFS